jgi:CDGSH-type Zn-finger protein
MARPEARRNVFPSASLFAYGFEPQSRPTENPPYREEYAMSESLPIIAQKSPIKTAVEEGKSYWWCSCGKSAKQPLCDGSHKGGTFRPLEYKAEKTGDVYFCGCKRTGKSPLCDGTHKAL